MGHTPVSLSRFLLVLTLALLLGACGASATPEAAQPDAAPPEQIVDQFYQAWISFEGNPINARLYDNTAFLTSVLIQRIDNHVAQGLRFDPVLCAQNIPQQIEIGEVTVSGDTARVVVQTIWSQGPDENATQELSVELVRVEGQWRIDAIVCPAF